MLPQDKVPILAVCVQVELVVAVVPIEDFSLVIEFFVAPVPRLMDIESQVVRAEALEIIALA